MIGSTCSPCCRCPEKQSVVGVSVSVAFECVRPSNMFFGPTANSQPQFSAGPVTHAEIVNVALEKNSVGYLNPGTTLGLNLPVVDKTYSLTAAGSNPLTGDSNVGREDEVWIFAGIQQSISDERQLLGATTVSPGTFQTVGFDSLYEVAVEIRRRLGAKTPPCYELNLFMKTQTTTFISNYIDVPYAPTPATYIHEPKGPGGFYTYTSHQTTQLPIYEAGSYTLPIATFRKQMIERNFWPYGLGFLVNGGDAAIVDIIPTVTLTYE
jgi:hypothetical protein